VIYSWSRRAYMFRGFIVTVLLVSAAQAFAGVTAESFTWERSGRFFLNLAIDGTATEFRGNMRLGETVGYDGGGDSRPQGDGRERSRCDCGAAQRKKGLECLGLVPMD
jgi:hypothetical protein